jgi:hypothetical protein
MGVIAYCNTSRDYDKNAQMIEDMFEYWKAKPGIKKRYTDHNGKVDEGLSKKQMESFLGDVLDKPFKAAVRFTDTEISRLRVSIDGYNKDLSGKFKNIAGIFAVPRGYARLDPTSQTMLMELERVKNFERNSISMVEQQLQDIRSLILKAHVDTGVQGKLSSLFGNKTYKKYRELRDVLIKTPTLAEIGKVQNEINDLFKTDEGRLLSEYNSLIKLNREETQLAINNGYIRELPSGKEVRAEYNESIITAAALTRQTLDALGHMSIKTLDAVGETINLKGYSGEPAKKDQLLDNIESAKDRIKKGIAAGDYFPRVQLQHLYNMKKGMNDYLKETEFQSIDTALEVINTEVYNIGQVLGRQMPDNFRARIYGDENLDRIWELDPLVVIEKYSRDAVQFNKNTFIQRSYLKAMKNILNADTDFIKGMKTFITEEYAVATENNLGREDWVNEMVRGFNGFQTVRTMGLNVTGGIKNAASVFHYWSKVGPKAIMDAKKLYSNKSARDAFDKAASEEGFLFAPDDASLLEGFTTRDVYSKGDLKFNETEGQYYFNDSKLRDTIGKFGDLTVSKLLFFHRMTENAQRQHMFKTSFLMKYGELRDNSRLPEKEIALHARRFALKMVNGWAYEYAPFAKSKYLRGDGIVVDESGDFYVTKKSKHESGFSGGVSEIAFHLMHYPMSLLETHIKEMKGAGQSIKAGQWDSPELQYAYRYGSLYGLISLGSILLNGNLHNIIENETLNRINRIESDLLDINKEDRATFGLLSEFSGPTLGHLKYLAITSGVLKLDTDLQKQLFGNVNYRDTMDEDVLRYTDYQYSTEYGRFKHKIAPAIKDGRGLDLMRHYLAFYPSDWIKSSRKVLGRHVPYFQKTKKQGNITQETRYQRALDVINASF